MQDTIEKLSAILREHIPGSAPPLTPTTRLDADLGLDSLDRYEVAYAVSDAFNVDLADDEVHAVLTFGDLCTLVQAKLA